MFIQCVKRNDRMFSCAQEGLCCVSLRFRKDIGSVVIQVKLWRHRSLFVELYTAVNIFQHGQVEISLQREYEWLTKLHVTTADGAFSSGCNGPVAEIDVS